MQKFIYTFSDNHGKTFSKLGVEGIFLSIQQTSYLLVKREECREGQCQATMARVALLLRLLFSCCVMCNSVATPRTVVHQTSLSMGFSWQKYWSGLPFFLQGIFPTQGLNLCLLHWQVDSLPLNHHGSPSPRKHFAIKKNRGLVWNLWQTPREKTDPQVIWKKFMSSEMEDYITFENISWNCIGFW